jgi:ABC-2 type transport system permease protein
VIGLPTLSRKELLESWRTKRLPVVLLLFISIGILSPLTARYLPEIIDLAVGDQPLPLPIPPPVVGDAVLQLQGNLGQLGAFAAIILAMGLVAWERERGTAAFVLSKPASRGAFLAAKFGVLASVLALATAVAVAVAWVYTAILFEPLSVGGGVVFAILSWLALLAWAAVTFLSSTVLRSAAAAAGVGIASLISLSIAAAIPPAARWLPAGLEGPAGAIALGEPFVAADLATAVVGTLLLIAVPLVVAWLVFRRQEL